MSRRECTELTKLYNRTMESERMPEEWRDSVLIPFVKNNGDDVHCDLRREQETG